MGFTIGWETGCTGKILQRRDMTNKIKKLYPKAKIEYDQTYKNFTIETSNGDLILEYDSLKDSYFETDLDLSGPYILFTTIYILLSIGCSIELEDKITKRDIRKNDLLKYSLKYLMDAGHKLDKKLVKQTLKIFYK
jgi:hypothetical protein